MRTSRILSALLCVSILSACGGHGGALPASGTNAKPDSHTYTGPASLADFSWGKSYLSDAQYLGPVSDGYLGVQVQVRMRNADGLLQYARSASDPKSPLYRHYLTPQQIADQFGASQSDYTAAAKYLAQNGLHVGGWPQREQLFVSGPISAMQRAFGTGFGTYSKDGQTFVAPSGAPHFSQTVPIEGVVGLVHAHTMHSYFMRVPNANFEGYTPQQVQRAFDYTGAYTKFDGAGINVAIVGTGPIMAQDLQKVQSVFGVRAATVTQPPVTDQGVAAALATEPTPAPSSSPWPAYYYSPGLSTPPPATDPLGSGCQTSPNDLTQCNPEDGEAQLDTQTIATLAPGSNVLFYLAYNANDCFNGQTCAPGTGYQAEGIYEMDAEIQQIIADNSADVVSLSVGGGEPLQVGGYYDQSGKGFGPIEYATLAAEGMAVFVSSGDTGAYECSAFAGIPAYAQYASTPCASYPASDPSVVSVGGVTAPMDDAGRILTPITAWGDQTTWGGNGSFQNNIGSGGGPSAYFAAPAWQAANASVSAVVKGMRGQPDISLLGDPGTGPAMVMDAAFPDAWGNYGGLFPTGGTSLAAPQMAAMWAIVLQACKADAVCDTKGVSGHPYRLGNPAPLFYGIYGNAAQYATTMADVTYGDNSAYPRATPTPAPGTTPGPKPTIMPGFQAGTGYDMVTGVGVPFAGHLINAVLTNAGGASPNLP